MSNETQKEREQRAIFDLDAIMKYNKTDFEVQCW